MRSDSTLQANLANDSVQWYFIPPAAPQFGGLWETSVKSFKFHLRRVIGLRTLSKDEFATILCQIEACLNSRPIAALNDDPGDLSALTPGHFLIGRSLLSVPTGVIQVHPGSDSHVRVVTLRTACGHYKQPITQICKLPVSSEKDALKNNSPQNKCPTCAPRYV
ncbi:hypothetical protein HN011_010972 [Eciton burchellii]|nr:hypothetical protein HN011_010972 [Eciton burchellii]